MSYIYQIATVAPQAQQSAWEEKKTSGAYA